MLRNFSLKSFYKKPVIPTPKEGLHPIILPNTFIGRYRDREMKKQHEQQHQLPNPDIRNGKLPLQLLINFNSPWTGKTVYYTDAIVFSPISRTGMKLWSYVHAPFHRKRWVKVTGTIIFLIGFGMTGVWFSYRQKVPITGRKQLAFVPDKILSKRADHNHQKLFQKMGQYILPKDHPTTIAIRTVFDHLLQSSELEGEPEEWEVFIVNAPSVQNAQVFYNKKVWIYSGMLNVAEDNNGMAVALSHEIAHIVAKHAPERFSNLLFWGFFGLPALPVIVAPVMHIHIKALAILWSLPWVAKMYHLSRSTEAEADYIGLTIMARAGYDIQEAVGFWERMEIAQEETKQQRIEEQSKKGKIYNEGPQFLSTHPTSEDRILQIKKMVPEIIEKTGWQ